MLRCIWLKYSRFLNVNEQKSTISYGKYKTFKNPCTCTWFLIKLARFLEKKWTFRKCSKMMRIPMDTCDFAWSFLNWRSGHYFDRLKSSLPRIFCFFGVHLRLSKILVFVHDFLIKLVWGWPEIKNKIKFFYFICYFWLFLGLGLGLARNKK